MRQFIIILFLSISAFAANWWEIQVIEIPPGTAIYCTVDSQTGKTKYTMHFNGLGVPVSKSNAEAFMAGKRRLELVKWYNPETGAYKYTIRQLKLGDIDLNELIKNAENAKNHH